MCFSKTRQGSVHQQQVVEVVVETDDARLIGEADRLIRLFGDSERDTPYALYFGNNGIELKRAGRLKQGGYRIDFSKIDRRVGSGNLSKKQPLSKSIGDNDTVVDATTGFGSDAIRLVLMGYRVIGIEKSPIISAMLRDGLWRAEQNKELSCAIGGRLSLIEMDSSQYISNLQPPQVVYLDPMFPPKRKKSALPPGHIQALQTIVGPEDQEETNNLFTLALDTATKRVVVKRPTHAPQMGTNPLAIHEGKLVRYEVYKPNNK
jgi:16S rRNA (guanine1516-N2)-methyltransferase